MSIAKTIDGINAEIAEIRAKLEGETPTTEGRESLLERLSALKGRGIAVQAAYNRLWEAQVSGSPATITRDESGTYYVTQGDGMGGGRSVGVTRSNPRYAEVEAEYNRRRDQDARIAEVAYAAWGWRGPVRIDYYGDRAVVTNGGRKLTVSLTQPATA